jgi:hypothetical protein
MDISKIQPTAKVTYEIGVQSVTLEVEYHGEDEGIDYRDDTRRTSEKVRELIARKVVGWDLTDGDKPLECNAENKAKYLPFILGRKDAEGVPIGWLLLAFMREPDNFLKN